MHQIRKVADSVYCRLSRRCGGKQAGNGTQHTSVLLLGVNGRMQDLVLEHLAVYSTETSSRIDQMKPMEFVY